MQNTNFSRQCGTENSKHIVRTSSLISRSTSRSIITSSIASPHMDTPGPARPRFKVCNFYSRVRVVRFNAYNSVELTGTTGGVSQTQPTLPLPL